MITVLYRAAVLALLYKLLEQQRETQRQLRTLHARATRPSLLLVSSTTPLSLPSPALSSGVTLKQPSTSFSASRSTTTPTTTTTGPTEGSGRSAETSGETGADFDLQGFPRTHPVYNKTPWLTPATSPEAGSLGPAPASSATGLELCPVCAGTGEDASGAPCTRPDCPAATNPPHNHEPRYPCTVGCRAYERVQAEKETALQDVKRASREQIWAAGYDPVCAAPGPHEEHTHLPAGRHEHVFDCLNEARALCCRCGVTEGTVIRGQR